MKNLLIIIIFLTLLTLGCGDTVSTQLNAENNKELVDELSIQNSELKRKITEQETIIKNLELTVESWKKREAFLICTMEYRNEYVDYVGNKLEGADEKLAECRAHNE
tara:strand:- start:441 stop:761 length:321 start_codon:yes stop_codon:yes gene_type:complete